MSGWFVKMLAAATFSLPSILLFDLRRSSFRPGPVYWMSAVRKVGQGRRDSAARRACP